jgi:hypothetical protein
MGGKDNEILRICNQRAFGKSLRQEPSARAFGESLRREPSARAFGESLRREPSARALRARSCSRLVKLPRHATPSIDRNLANQFMEGLACMPMGKRQAHCSFSREALFCAAVSPQALAAGSFLCANQFMEGLACMPMGKRQAHCSFSRAALFCAAVSPQALSFVPISSWKAWLVCPWGTDKHTAASRAKRSSAQQSRRRLSRAALSCAAVLPQALARWRSYS